MSIAAKEGEQTVSAGLFGAVSGALGNIVYTADYSAKSTDNYAVNNGYSISGNGSKYYVGAIAGHLTSTGSIDNTAAAGLVINSYAYDNAQLNAGGLVGLNEGSISRSSADLPVIMIRTNGGAGAFAAGFAGINRGSIESCYSLSYINISRAASDSIGQVYLGGFAARNYAGAGIYYSYCANATISENIDDDKRSGFTLSGGGNVSSSCYVDGGNYYYVDSIYALNVGDDVINETAGKAVTGTQLASTSTDSQVTELTDMVRNGGFNAEGANAYNCSNTAANNSTDTDGSTTSTPQYTYPAIVKDAEGNYVHYGEWIIDANYSDAGFAYWEYEEGGSNRGYHFYIIDANGKEYSTLCTAHDDGGVVSDYGYGYYYRKSSGNSSQTAPGVSWENVNIDKTGFANAEPYTKAQDELTRQFAGKYTFVLYKTTKDADKSGSSTHEKADKGMFLINSTHNINGVDVTNGGAYALCRLTVTMSNADSRELNYVFCPFFARSMLLYSYSVNAGTDTATGMAYPGTADGTEHDTQKKQYDNDQLTRAAAGTAGSSGITASDTMGASYTEASDTTASSVIRAYDISTTALGTGDASGIVTAATDSSDTIEIPDYMKQGIPFEIRSVYQLQNINWRTDKYDAVTEVGSSDAKEIGTGGKPSYQYLAWYGYDDSVYKNGSTNYLNGVPDDDVYNYYWKQTHDVNGKGNNFTPIGSLYDTKPWVDGWGSGDATRTQPYAAFFNGDYNGDSYVIRNISISSTAQTVGLFGVEVAAKLRNIILYSDSNNIIASEGDTSYWYMLGSLAGLAGKGTIENCVVSGYTVQDNRAACSHGDATIGAFIGLCATSMSRCSSNNDLVLNSTHGYTRRVGGMVGITTGKISSSYCGGSITNKTSSGAVYIGGFIGGEWFRGAGLEALTGAGNFEDNSSSMKPEIENSYSFIKLPNISGNIKNVKVFATTADLDNSVRTDPYGATPVTITVKNCFYYGMYAGNAKVDAVIAKDDTSIYDLKYLNFLGNNIPDPASEMALDYTTMSRASTNPRKSMLEALNLGGGGFGMVTTTENGGQKIDGKYSFPGSDKELIGQNYPFPTIVTQEDPFDSTKTVNVHYGQWPKGTALYSDASSMTLDLLSSTGGSADCTADVKVKFYDNSTAADMSSAPTLSFKSAGGADSSDIVKYTLTASTADGGSTVPQYYVLTLDGWNEGYETITVSYTHSDGKTYSTVINVAVTAELNIKAWSTDSTNSNPKVGQTASYTANAYDANNTAIKDLLSTNWEASTANRSIAEVDKDKISLDADGNIVIPVIGNKAGRTTLSITVSGVLPKNHGKFADDSRTLTQTYNMDVSVTQAEATTAKVQLYAYDTRLDSDSNHLVAVDSGNAISSDSTSAANFAYWTEQVANDSTINGGKTFAGWVTEDGKSVTAATTFSSTTNVYASWKCTKVTFTDGGAETGSRYYHGGSFYTDSTLRTTSSVAPQPLSTHGADETFTGYWTAADGATSGSQVTDKDCTFISNALSSPKINGVETAVDENTAELTVYAVFTTDTAAP